MDTEIEAKIIEKQPDEEEEEVRIEEFVDGPIFSQS